jgi:hypothetical protein
MLAAPAAARPRLNMPGGWTWPPSTAMKAEGEACLHHLDALGVAWRRAPARRKVATPIYLDDMTVGGVALVPRSRKGPFVMDCLLAATLADSADVFRSLGVAELRFAEIYDYRNINMGQRPILSRHALGLAIDVLELVTDDGVDHVVERDYPDALLATLEEWLRATGSWRLITPATDPRHHRDHFHLEVNVDYRIRKVAARHSYNRYNDGGGRPGGGTD